MKKPRRSRRSFLSEFIRERKTVGSIAPSSRVLARRMIAPIDFKKAKCIVELGPGEGVITRQIISRLQPGCHLVSFELSERFVKDFLQFDNPQVHIINDSAEHIGKHLERLGLPKADYIISSLPLTNFPKPLKEGILDEAVANLKSGGTYTQFQYMVTVAKLLRSRFDRVHIGWTARNLPPAFIYTCTKNGEAQSEGKAKKS